LQIALWQITFTSSEQQYIVDLQFHAFHFLFSNAIFSIFTLTVQLPMLSCTKYTFAFNVSKLKYDNIVFQTCHQKFNFRSLYMERSFVKNINTLESLVIDLVDQYLILTKTLTYNFLCVSNINVLILLENYD